MPGLFQGISTMNSALRAFQRALDVTGHNITNVNTPGYSRQEVQLSEMAPTLFQGGAENFFMGNGVTAASISRIQDQFLFTRQTQVSSESGRLGSLLDGLNRVQTVMNEPGGASIGDAMNKLFNAFSAFGSNPSDNALRQQVQQAGDTLASRIRGMYSNLQTQMRQTQSTITGTIQHAQDLIDSIAQMNKQIVEQQAPGAIPNDLLDSRDQAIQQLSQLIPVTVQPQDNGSVWVYSGQLTLVDLGGASTLPTTYDAAAGALTSGSTQWPVHSGELLGLFQTVQKISGYESQLDDFANSIRTQFNTMHATGTNLLGATGQNFFNDSNPQTGAIDFDLDPAVKADPRAIAGGVSGNPGDGGLALSISALRDTPVAALGGRTFSTFYGDLVSGVGQDVATTKSAVDTSSAIQLQLTQQIQSVSGVSIDDEMANMLRFQRSYQAAAKALSVFDQTTEDLLNIIR